MQVKKETVGARLPHEIGKTTKNGQESPANRGSQSQKDRELNQTRRWNHDKGYNSSENGMPGYNSSENGMPGYNSSENGMPGYNSSENGMPGYNSSENGMPLSPSSIVNKLVKP